MQKKNDLLAEQREMEEEAAKVMVAQAAAKVYMCLHFFLCAILTQLV